MDHQKQLLDKYKKVCICRSITGATITNAMKNGALSFEALRRKIRVGTGSCKAKRCRTNIERRVREYKESMQAKELTPVFNESESVKVGGCVKKF